MNSSVNTSEFQPYQPAYTGLVASSVYMTLLVIIGAIGNILVIIGVLMSPRLRSHSFHVFTINLSIADLGVNLIVIPLGLKSLFTFGWPHNPTSCRIVFYLNTITLGVSLETLTMIALNRFFLITKSRQTVMKFCGLKPIIIASVAVWIIVIILCILPEFGFGVFQYNPYIRVCFMDNSDLSSWWYLNAVFIFMMVVFFSTIPILYILTFRAVRASKLRVHAQMDLTHNAVVENGNSVNQQVTRSVQPKEGNKAKPTKISTNEIRLTQITALIFIVLVVCWSPLFIVHFFNRNSDVPVPIQRLTSLLLYTN